MTVRREQIEELLELCWTAAEDGLHVDRDHLPDRLLCFLPHPIEANGTAVQDVIDVMLHDGLLHADGRGIALTPPGRTQASEIVRRHRLTEVLLQSVLDVSEESIESTACQVEHILNAEVTEAVCAFLGHPPSCPHGRSIPRGSCCDRAHTSPQPLLVPLSRLEPGEEAMVALVHTQRQGYLHQLGTFGLVPGRKIRLRRRQPALIVQIGATELALDSQAADEIIVRRPVSRSTSPSTSRA